MPLSISSANAGVDPKSLAWPTVSQTVHAAEIAENAEKRKEKKALFSVGMVVDESCDPHLHRARPQLATRYWLQTTLAAQGLVAARQMLAARGDTGVKGGAARFEGLDHELALMLVDDLFGRRQPQARTALPL